MLCAIFSDIHSNLEAYQAFLEDARKEGIEKYFCVGDIVGYNANPRQCIELTKELKCPVVCGNHDWAVSLRMGMDYFNYNARKALVWTQQALDDIDKDYLANLKLIYQNDELTLVHGTLDRPEEFGYVIDMMEAARAIHLQQTPLCFIGHSHVAGIFFEDKDRNIVYSVKPILKIAPARRYLINAGSIGQPRDRDWRSSYCIYDNQKKTLRIKRLEYDLRKTQDKILEAGLPSFLAMRLAEGR